MKKDALHEQVSRVLSETYESCRTDIAVSAALLAELAFEQIDNGQTPIVPRYLSVLQLRQMARVFLRGHVEEEEVDRDAEDLFGYALQIRYPVTRNGEEVYVQREHMTPREYDENASRLEREAQSKLEHARALRAEKEHRQSLGHFVRAA